MISIKLGLSNNGKAPDFYRRVKVDANDAGIAVLKRQAIVLFQQDQHGVTAATEVDADLDAFVVTLFYVDTDGDRILICNETDLMEALEEGRSNRELMSAVVVAASTRSSIKLQATVVPAEQPARSQSTQTFARTTTETGTEPSPSTVVDALADLVHSVAVTAQAGVEAAAQVAQEAHRDQQKAIQAEARKNLHIAKLQLKRAKQTSKEQLKVASRQVKDSVRAVKTSAATSKDALKQTIMDQQDVVAREMNDLAAKVTSVVSSEEPAPFIHGRHTCDLCLTSPIIGTRFHATNLPDYDLCAACHGNYQGDDITFEEATLDRDCGLQKRWLSKYARIVQINHHQGRRHGSPGGCHRPHRGGGRGGGRRGCHRPHHPHGPHHGPPRHHRRGGPHHPHGPPHGHHAPPLHPHGIADPPAVPPHAPGWAEPGCAMPPPPEDAALAEAIRRSLTTDDPAPVLAYTVESDEEEESVITDPATGKTEDVSTEEEESVAEQEEEQEEEEEEEEEDEEEEEELDDEPEVVAEKRQVDVEVADLAKEAVETVEDEVTADETKEATLEKLQERNSSFESDALDSGSVAQFMGETLDRFSEAIDSLNSQVEGATIVDGEANDDDTSSKDSWSVVEDDQMTSDEHLARAAVMLGSALFQSDNNIASSAGSASAISSITSVPSEMPSLIPSVMQTERWSAQLEQLHEMGMHDDAKYVEVMEMLAAANIGSDENEEITVTQVLNHMM